METESDFGTSVDRECSLRSLPLSLFSFFFQLCQYLLTSCAGTTRIFCSKIAISSQFWILFKQNKIGKTNNKFIYYLSIIFCPVISYRRVQKESDKLFCTVWSLVMVRSQSVGMTFHARREFFCARDCKYFLSFRYICNSGKTNNKFITSR